MRKPTTFQIDERIYNMLKIVAANKHMRIYQLMEEIFLDYLEREGV